MKYPWNNIEGIKTVTKTTADRRELCRKEEIVMRNNKVPSTVVWSGTYNYIHGYISPVTCNCFIQVRRIFMFRVES